MKKRNALLCCTAMAVAFLAGACSDTTPTRALEPAPEKTSLFRIMTPDLSTFDRTLDAEFVRIASEVPGFGGYFYDETGALNIYSAGMRPTSMSALGTRLAALNVDLDAQPVRVLAGQYDFAQLDAMHRLASRVLAVPGVVFTDADESRNRIVIGVESATAAQAVEAALATLGLPAEAVIIERTEPIRIEQSLRDMVRPVAGGLQINFTRGEPPSGFICTHGFNVRSPGSGVQGFVTNSHCSDTRGVVLNTPYWQHSRFVENTFIGTEVHDLPFFTGGVCPAGRNCRWSDALGAMYAPGVPNAFGRIYRTMFPGTTTAGSLDIDPANPQWEIVNEVPFPVVGQTLHKTGRTTGWTMGVVTATCQNSNVAGDGFITMLCQDRVATTSAGGDSGAPYFLRIGETNNVELIGIHWGSGGGTTVLSSMSNIRFENEGPAPWITFPGQTPP